MINELELSNLTNKERENLSIINKVNELIHAFNDNIFPQTTKDTFENNGYIHKDDLLEFINDFHEYDNRLKELLIKHFDLR